MTLNFKANKNEKNLFLEFPEIARGTLTYRFP